MTKTTVLTVTVPKNMLRCFVPAAYGFACGEGQCLQGFKLGIAARRVVISLLGPGVRWAMAAVLQLFESMKNPLFGQRFKNNFQTMRADRRPS